MQPAPEGVRCITAGTTPFCGFNTTLFEGLVGRKPCRIRRRRFTGSSGFTGALLRAPRKLRVAAILTVRLLPSTQLLVIRLGHTQSSVASKSGQMGDHYGL